MKRENHKLTIRRNASAYCETTTIHGFVYWIEAENILERLFWVAAVCLGFLFGSLIVSRAFQDWRERPGVTIIQSFSAVCNVNHVGGNKCLKQITYHKSAVRILGIVVFQDLTKVDFPSITLCNEHGLDSGQYVRNVFNNLDFVGNKSAKLKEGFGEILNGLTNQDSDLYMFVKLRDWMRYGLLVKIIM